MKRGLGLLLFLLVAAPVLSQDPPVDAANRRAAPASSAAPTSSGLTWLLAQQNQDGSWGEPREQRFSTTALLLIGLAAPACGQGEALELARGKAAEFIMGHQVESGAFLDGARDRTLLGVLALVAWRDRERVEATLASALILVEPELRRAFEARWQTLTGTQRPAALAVDRGPGRR